jgi:hypothetical protein
MSNSNDFYPSSSRKICPNCANVKNQRIICTDRLIEFYDNMAKAYGEDEDDFDDDMIYVHLDDEFNRTYTH